MLALIWENTTMIANAVQGYSLMSGHYDCQDLGFSIVWNVFMFTKVHWLGLSTLPKRLKFSKWVSRIALWRCSLNIFDFVIFFVFVFVFEFLLVKSCVIITLIKSFKGHKSLGSLCSVTLIVSGALPSKGRTDEVNYWVVLDSYIERSKGTFSSNMFSSTLCYAFCWGELVQRKTFVQIGIRVSPITLKCQMSNDKDQRSSDKCQMSMRLNLCRSVPPEFLQ